MSTSIYWKYKPQPARIVQEDRKQVGSAGERSCWSTA